MSISNSELKHILKETEFPFCARIALGRVGRLSSSYIKARWPARDTRVLGYRRGGLSVMFRG